MGPVQAIGTCFRKFATFSGRAGRAEYWWWVVFTIVVQGVMNLIDRSAHLQYGSEYYGQRPGFISTVAAVIILLPSIAVLFRRLHDTGRSGWWWALNLVCCIGTIVVFILTLLPGQSEPNRYGSTPGSALT